MYYNSQKIIGGPIMSLILLLIRDPIISVAAAIATASAAVCALVQPRVRVDKSLQHHPRVRETNRDASFIPRHALAANDVDRAASRRPPDLSVTSCSWEYGHRPSQEGTDQSWKLFPAIT